MTALYSNDDTTPIIAIQVLDVAILVAAATGEIDLNEMARRELANRGLNESGEWVGFDRVREIRRQELTGVRS